MDHTLRKTLQDAAKHLSSQFITINVIILAYFDCVFVIYSNTYEKQILVHRWTMAAVHWHILWKHCLGQQR